MSQDAQTYWENKLNEELANAHEAVERLAEFATELASDREAFKEGMEINCKNAFHFLSELEAVEGGWREDVATWRQLCHSRAVQLNEAYDTIARLRSEVDELQRTIDDMISH